MELAWSLQRPQCLPHAPDHAFQAAQEAREEDHVTAPCRRFDHRAPAGRGSMRRMDGFISSSLALVVLALHLSVDGCSAVNLEGTGLRLATGAWFRRLHCPTDLPRVPCGVRRVDTAQIPVKSGGGSVWRHGRLEPARQRSLQLERRALR